MAFRIREQEGDASAEWIGEWSFPAHSHLIASDAFDVLYRELERYVLGEVPGRSFLIAGHRGAGKTTLVRRAVDELNRDILRLVMGQADGSSPGSTALPGRQIALQRPLLVRLHGPSLLDSAEPNSGTHGGVKPAGVRTERADRATHQQFQSGNPAEEIAPQAAGETAPMAALAVAAAAAALAANGKAEAANDAGAKYKKDDPKSPDETVIALEQITIGLYRAFAAEAGRCFAARASETTRDARINGSSTGDLVEVAAQFTLELDNAPKPNLLRAYYNRLGCVETGIFWPRQVGAYFVQGGLLDQGAREMVALATAAQAFEVCSGDVKSTETHKDTRGREESIETKSEFIAKDFVNKALGVAAGIAVGFGTAAEAGSPGVAAAAGLAAGLVTTGTLSLTSKRSLKSEQTVDYAFIRDRSKRSLERDLPLVIQRVREAGLAPVFVVDELDKIPEETAAVPRLIRRLKHLTTDYGLFCFLTDRRYFDEIMRKVEAEAFPPEHTFFSHRLYVLQRPQAMLDYLSKVILPAASGTPETAAVAAATAAAAAQHGPLAAGFQENASTELALSTLGLYVLHRSKLNTVDLARELARLSRDDGSLRLDAGGVFNFGFRFAATIQLAINLVLRGREMALRFETEPRFAQLAVDALYHLSRAWEGEAATVALNRAAVVDCLLRRTRSPVRADAASSMSNSGTIAAAEAERELLSTRMGQIDLDLLVKQVAELADLLSDFKFLQNALEREYGAEGRNLANIVPGQFVSRLIEPDKKSGEGVFRFLFDVYGNNIANREALRAASSSGLPTGMSETIDQEVATVAAFGDALAAVGLTIEDFIGVGVLPPTLEPSVLDAAMARLRTVQATGMPYEELDADQLTVGAVASIAQQRSWLVTILLRLAIDVAATVAWSVPLSTALVAIGRFVDLQGVFNSPSPASSTDSPTPLSGSAVDLIELAREASKFVGSDGLVPWAPPETTGSVGPEVVRRWRAEVVAYLSARQRPRGDASPQFSSQQALTDQAWSLWAQRLRAYLVDGRPIVSPPSFTDVACAARGLLPGAVFQRDLSRMSLADWTAVCLLGFPTQLQPVGLFLPSPTWTFVVGLRVLGFGRDLIQEAVEEFARTPTPPGIVLHLDGLAKYLNRWSSPDQAVSGLFQPPGDGVGAARANGLLSRNASR